MEATIRSIGCIRTPYRTLAECPRNVEPDGPLCTLQIDAEFAAGLRGLETGQYVWVLYWLGDADRGALVRRRRQSGEELGVFALRSPHRPNPIGAAALRIETIRDTTLEVRGLDCLDGTPLLDIRPAMFAERNGEGRWAVVG
jgi:tRNA-Thr(GGU) m(6)t(6)A37 methyltransferase TsaA